MPEVTIDQALQLALQHHKNGQVADAENILRQVLAVQPNHALALYYLGMIAMQFNNYAAGVELLQQSVAASPDFLDALISLGNAYLLQNKFPEAAEYLQRAVNINPNLADILNNLGFALLKSGKHTESISIFERAIALNPNRVELHNQLGNAFQAVAKFAEAAECYERVIQLQPHSLSAYQNLATIALTLGQPELTIQYCEQAIALAPESVETYNILGNAFQSLKQYDNAVKSYRQAIELKPDFAVAINNLGLAWQLLDQHDQALEMFEKVISIAPNYPNAYNNAGTVLQQLGRFEEAIPLFHKALTLRPQKASFHDCYLFALNFHPGFDAAAIAREQTTWRQQLADPLKQFIPLHQNNRDPNRRLKIGYVSANFNGHVVGCNFIPLIREHDRDQFEIVCYSNSINTDSVTDAIRPRADVWKSIVGLDDQSAAEMIRNDNIDILVDLTMHMTNARMLLFARKPAPVQVTCFAYPGSTGLDTIDYRLTDPYLDPPGMFDQYYSEKSYRLPDSFWCYDVEGMYLDKTAPVANLPAQKNGFITFGCLNNFSKVNESVLKLWANVLRETPNSKLITLVPQGNSRRRVSQFMASESIADDRIQFINYAPRHDYMAMYNQIDIALETLPYNGHTTSLDSLWMGVPTVSILGNTVVGRAGFSQLSNLGLQHLVANSPEQYLQLIHQLTSDLDTLSELRHSLRDRMLASPLMDATRFARNIEAAYRIMWRTWCESQN